MRLVIKRCLKFIQKENEMKVLQSISKKRPKKTRKKKKAPKSIVLFFFYRKLILANNQTCSHQFSFQNQSQMIPKSFKTKIKTKSSRKESKEDPTSQIKVSPISCLTQRGFKRGGKS